MNHLGQTRSSYQRDHLLHTPDAFVRAPLPGMTNASAIVHAAPAIGARFTEYTVEMEENGSFALGQAQSFLYVLEGSVEFNYVRLDAHHYAWFPPHQAVRVTSTSAARVVVIEKPHIPLDRAVPRQLTGNAAAVAPEPMTPCDESVQVRHLLPDDAVFDCAVNTMTFLPGATLPMVEIHVMEHGLLMLEGEGIYRLGENWYPVKAGDFIWMAPYCPQWFGALGKTPTRYLIYKDWNRHPLM